MFQLNIGIFQLTRSRGAWLMYDNIYKFFNRISTHTLTWSVTCCKRYSYRQYGFQLTRSRGAWPVDTGVYLGALHGFQLTRSRGAWRRTWEDFDFTLNISTHTLTWSVTIKCTMNDCFDLISTHTLTWSVTSNKNGKSRFKKISTHTLTWSVTPCYH